MEVIEVAAPELSGPEADQYIVIDDKVTRRLAQRPGSYVVLEYHHPVLKHLPSQTLTTVAAPTAVFEGSLADVSLLAGMVIDKFAYHLPLYRQHQRLRDAGITLSRTTLTHYVQRAIELLRPIYDAQLQHVLRSRVLAMDETPHKAGRKGKGKLKAVWYWPIYGEDDEVCFTYSASRARQHVDILLETFEGTLLTDGYAAYERFAANRPEVTHAQCWAHYLECRFMWSHGLAMRIRRWIRTVNSPHKSVVVTETAGTPASQVSVATACCVKAQVRRFPEKVCIALRFSCRFVAR